MGGEGGDPASEVSEAAETSISKQASENKIGNLVQYSQYLLESKLQGQIRVTHIEIFCFKYIAVTLK